MTSKIASEGPHLAERDVVIDGVSVRVIKLQDDPVCLRASLGGDPVAGYYLTYRGDEAAIAHLLDATQRAFLGERTSG